MKFNSNERMMTLANFYDITNFLIKAIAPIIPTTAEDAYMHFNKINKLESIHLESFDVVKKYDANVLKEWDEFFVLKDEVNLLLENAIKNGLIKRTNEAKVTIKNPKRINQGIWS
nr:class I tRNA ligase family protein [Mycoplasmopsis bovis]